VNLLELRDVDAHYADRPALRGVTLTVEEGEFAAVLGPHGAGKSTLLRAVAGSLRAAAGEILLEGETVTRRSPAAMRRLGVGHVPQGGGTFGPLSVLDNLRLGAWTQRGPLDNAYARVFELFPFLYERRHDLAGTLSVGEQRLLALGSAVMAKPRLLLCDEPSAGVPGATAEEVFAALRELHGRGTAIVVAEQSAGSALGSASHAVVLDEGRVTFDGPAGELTTAPAATEALLAE
jgi:branched-chain amino acid transport system ATP-binding protein